MPDDLIHNLDELFAATGVGTLYDMSDHLYAVLELDLDANCSIEGEGTLTVIIGTFGLVFEFPFPLDDFYAGVEELNEEAEREVNGPDDPDDAGDDGSRDAGEQEGNDGPECWTTFCMVTA